MASWRAANHPWLSDQRSGSSAAGHGQGRHSSSSDKTDLIASAETDSSAVSARLSSTLTPICGLIGPSLWRRRNGQWRPERWGRFSLVRGLQHGAEGKGLKAGCRVANITPWFYHGAIQHAPTLGPCRVIRHVKWLRRIAKGLFIVAQEMLCFGGVTSSVVETDVRATSIIIHHRDGNWLHVFHSKLQAEKMGYLFGPSAERNRRDHTPCAPILNPLFSDVYHQWKIPGVYHQ